MGILILCNFGYIVAPLMVASFPGSACAMNSSSAQLIACRVVDGDKLPADSGGPDALCTAIRNAAAAEVPASKFSVEVRVLGNTSLAATLTTADGTIL
ncbi:MAG: hypothetical protein Q8K85_08315, partial [Hyphomicrobium sp.]|nr:hypothetical protein [Hyphomicrobium sp.]